MNYCAWSMPCKFFEENGEVCPAGWKKGDAGMNANPKGVAEYLSNHAEKL